MNLRPPGPELQRRRFPLVRRLLTASQALEIRKGDRHARILSPRFATTGEARLVAPVSPERSRRYLHGQANPFSPSRKSRRSWESVERPRTAFAKTARSPTYGSPTRSACPKRRSKRSLQARTGGRGPVGPRAMKGAGVPRELVCRCVSASAAARDIDRRGKPRRVPYLRPNEPRGSSEVARRVHETIDLGVDIVDGVARMRTGAATKRGRWLGEPTT